MVHLCIVTDGSKIESMTKAHKVAMFMVTAVLLIVSALAYIQPNDTPGKWHSLFPIVLGIWAGYGLSVLITYGSKKK
jgi:hypothetical protein